MGDETSKGTTHVVTLAIAAALALSALSPASAATRHKRAVAAAAQTEPVELTASPRARPDWSPIPTLAGPECLRVG
jgi:hypothetical protein